MGHNSVCKTPANPLQRQQLQRQQDGLQGPANMEATKYQSCLSYIELTSLKEKLLYVLLMA